MSEETSEQRTLPATPKKLRDARKKGQVARSRDALVAASLAGALLYLWIFLPSAAQRFHRVLEVTGDEAAEPFDAAFSVIWPHLLGAAVEIIVPLLIVVVLTTVLAGTLVLRGLVFSFHPILPRFERINPAKGLKRLFRLAQFVELIKSVIKTALIFSLYVGTALYLAPSLVLVPRCGINCLFAVAAWLFTLLAGGGTIVLILSALFDVPLQRRLFLRDMRMTRTELRRERRDLEGDPQVVRARRRRREDVVSGSTLGLRNASLLLIDPAGGCLGLRYVPGETPAPMVVCRAEGGIAAASMITQARLLGVATAMEPDLCRNLLKRKLPLGEYVPEELFRAAAAALLRAGVV